MKGQFLLLFIFAVSFVSSFPQPDESDESAESSEKFEKKLKKDKDDICSLPPVKPSPIACAGAFPKWTFNSQKDICEPFVYGGCGATENLFSDEFACLKKCNNKVLLRGKARAQMSEVSPCLLPKAPGNCRAHVPSFYFDAETFSCLPFTYTGCKGNANNFRLLEDCQLTCREHLKLLSPVAVTLPALIKDDGAVVVEATSTKPGEVAPAEDVCSLPPIDNPFACLAFHPSWTFNSKKGKCEPYVYGGCGKTANLFQTEEACNAKCNPTQSRVIAPRNSCLLPVSSGPCSAHIKRYAFIQEKNRCEVFTYGGCQGNANHFLTADECFAACGGDLPSLDGQCEGVSCPSSNKYFADKGCRPQYKDNACCPTSFSCPKADEQAEQQCHYRGISYKIGEAVSLLTEDDPCQTNCICQANADGGVSIKCTDIQCPVPEGKEGCTPIMKHGQCCPKSYKCPEDKASSEEDIADTCLFEGSTYVKGQKINVNDPCKSCICVPGFKGLEGPGCRDIHCHLEVPNGCVPIFVDGVCCPSNYKCAQSVNKTRIIRVEGTRQGITTLPILIPGGRRQWQVKDGKCLLQADQGPCEALIPQFYYDADQQKCLQFNYGGCQGNENRFGSEEECLSACILDYSPSAVTKSDQVVNEQKESVSVEPIEADVVVKQPAAVNVCEMPKQEGLCRGQIPAYFYNVETDDCEFFWYGGCRGNGNRFESVAECRNRCQQRTPSLNETNEISTTTEIKVPDYCKLNADIGPCRGFKPRFYFNAEAGECQSFNYGGCRGNENNFPSTDECENVCKRGMEPSVVAPIKSKDDARQVKCKLPADAGFCRGFAPRFFYDSQEKKCKSFTWGGCKGNANNFLSEEDCIAECSPVALHGARARAMPMFGARRLPITQQKEENIEPTSIRKTKITEDQCIFGNATLNLGDRVESEDPCEECICSTPPEITCTVRTCPGRPSLSEAVCKEDLIEGQCCPVYRCVSANPPFIDVCQDVVCNIETEHCEVKSQESEDGIWRPPIGVCVSNDLL